MRIIRNIIDFLIEVVPILLKFLFIAFVYLFFAFLIAGILFSCSIGFSWSSNFVFISILGIIIMILVEAKVIKFKF